VCGGVARVPARGRLRRRGSRRPARCVRRRARDRGAGVISTVAAGTLQLVAVRRLGSAPTALITCLEIVVVVMASAALFAEPITIRLMAGALLVSAGAALAPSVLRPSPVAAPACV
jgi:hypothetical protein